MGCCMPSCPFVHSFSYPLQTIVVLRETYFRLRPESKEVSSKKGFTAIHASRSTFTFPFCFSRWSERVRRLSSPGKIVFLEVIQNEVGSLSSFFLTHPDPCSSSALHHGPKKIVYGIWLLPRIGMTFVRCFPRRLATSQSMCKDCRGYVKNKFVVGHIKLNDHASGHVSL